MKKILSLVLLFIACFCIKVPAHASVQSDYVDGRVTEIVNQLDIKNADAYHKVLAINDYIYNHFEFTCTYTPDTAYSLLKTGGANCQGFCQLFEALTKKVGIESATVYQDYFDHRWNVVKMDDNKYYFIDTASERYTGLHHYRFLKGTKGFYYTMNSTFKYNVSDTDYKYTEKPVEVKPTESEPVETKPAEEIKIEEPKEESKPQVTNPPAEKNESGNSLGLFIFSNYVKLDYSKVASSMFSAWKKK